MNTAWPWCSPAGGGSGTELSTVNVLIIGGGGREHALAWKCAQSPLAAAVFAAPGNAGTAAEPGVTNVDIAANDISALAGFAAANDVGLTIPGPEAALVAGVVDAFTAHGLRCCGPRQNAARLEGSKAFAKQFMARHNIPSAAWREFTAAEVDAAIAYVQKRGAPLVVKADGLAAGKGVVVAATVEQAVDAVRAMLSGRAFGDAGATVVVEDFVAGEEASFICIADGETVIPLAASQDHKARDAGDRGPNTGGMGAVSPAPVVTDAVAARVMETVIRPAVAGLAAEGAPYTGFLYAGLMIDDAGNPQVLEFNCRLGDPETQPLLMRLQSDLVQLCTAAAGGELGAAQTKWDARAAAGVVLAAGGYPGEVRRGDVIHGLAAAEGDGGAVKIFHAGTKLVNGETITAGGRVLCATALGATLKEAQQRAYTSAAAVQWPGMFYRADIGRRAIQREQTGEQP